MIEAKRSQAVGILLSTIRLEMAEIEHGKDLFLDLKTKELQDVLSFVFFVCKPISI